MPSENEKTTASAEIMYMFKYQFRDDWAPESVFAGKTRVWVKVFNELVEKGFITKKKKVPGWQYKWMAAYPDGF
jgi:hypothetical protein